MIEHIINIFAPLQCVSCSREGAIVCERCQPSSLPLLEICHFCKNSGKTVCLNCHKTSGISDIYAATEYGHTAQKIVHALKYERSRAAARYMARTLAVTYPDIFARGVLCHVPTAHARIRQRGYDQAGLVARELMRLTSLRHLSLLARYSNARQVGSSRLERQTNMKHAFYVYGMYIPQNDPIILVDDVITTGSTMQSAAALLRQHTDVPIVAVSYALKR